MENEGGLADQVVHPGVAARRSAVHTPRIKPDECEIHCRIDHTTTGQAVVKLDLQARTRFDGRDTVIEVNDLKTSRVTNSSTEDVLRTEEGAILTACDVENAGCG